MFVDESAVEDKNDKVALYRTCDTSMRNSSLEIPTVRFKPCLGSSLSEIHSETCTRSSLPEIRTESFKPWMGNSLLENHTERF
jgi:hypothetical protein